MIIPIPFDVTIGAQSSKQLLRHSPTSELVYGICAIKRTPISCVAEALVQHLVNMLMVHLEVAAPFIVCPQLCAKQCLDHLIMFDSGLLESQIGAKSASTFPCSD